jgi:hypothetical protein
MWSGHVDATPDAQCAVCFRCPCWLQPLIDTLSATIASCGRRNLRIVLDAISTSVDVLGGRELAQHPASVQKLMVAVFSRCVAGGRP